jgi:hypothetical protein
MQRPGSDEHPPDVLSEHANIPSVIQLKHLLISAAHGRKYSTTFGHFMSSDNTGNTAIVSCDDMILEKHSANCKSLFP